MACPCCGEMRPTEALECLQCGARQVGEPLAPPERQLPRLGPALGALSIPLLVIAAFLALWLFGNDMKVLRVIAVDLLGDSTSTTRSWLRIDPTLPFYRIIRYDAYRLAFYLSAGLVPLSALGWWMGRRARRLAETDAERFGGRRLASAATMLSISLFFTFSALSLSAIPEAIERGRERRLAATRAVMYELHENLLRKYYREYGTYPQELSDLSRVSREVVTGNDYWERALSYAPVSVIASKNGAHGFSNYKMVSAGPDGEFGTDDDITMIDGVIVSTPSEPNLETGWSAPTKPRP